MLFFQGCTEYIELYKPRSRMLISAFKYFL